jgi:glycosyltransferase involved in cell wall biosynthesis
MHIAFIGRVTLSVFAREFAFDHSFPDVKWGFPLGSEMVLGLVRRGHKVSVVTSDHRYKETQVFHSDSCDVYIVPEQGGLVRNLTFFRREVSTIAALVRSLKPDVVFAQWTYQNAEAGIKSGYPTLVVAHDSPWRVFNTFRNLQSLFKAVYATLFVMPKIKHITAVSPHIVREIKKFKYLEKAEVTVIPNGVEIQDEDSCVERVDCVGDGDRRIVVCVSQKGRLKNSGTLFAAWKMLRHRHPNWCLKVYGQGMPEGQVHRAEIDRVLREEADLFVSPSLEESFGMVFVEAMRFGVPCIGGEKSGAVPWVMGDGGVVCDVTKPEKLAECIERVIGDTKLRRRLGECGRRRVKEMFDIEKVVDLYEAELKRVAAEG